MIGPNLARCMSRVTLLGGVLLLAGIAPWAQADESQANSAVETWVASGVDGLAVPPGFRVTQFSDDQLAHDIYSMAFDGDGQLWVSGRGYVKRLIDDDGDEVADRAETFSDFPKSGSMGMCWDGGRWELEDADNDGRADPPRLMTRLRNPEHGAHAIRKGPDGWFYLLCGNDANVNADDHATTGRSPVERPQSG